MSKMQMESEVLPAKIVVEAPAKRHPSLRGSSGIVLIIESLPGWNKLLITSDE